MRLFYGKYRGKVEGNVDSEERGRLQVSVPAVLGSGKSSWAEPCVPYAGSKVGFFALPPKGANVWVEFEAGNPNFPIWSGCFWGKGEVPVSPAGADTKVFKTGAVKLEFNDASGSGGLKIEVSPPAVSSKLEIILGSSGIELKNGKSTVKLTLASVSINDGKLEVM